MARNPRAIGTSLRGLRRFFPGLVGLVSALSWALCFYPATAAAVGPLVGPTCKLYFTAPTTNTEGSAIPAGGLTYNVYVVQSATQPTAPAATPTLSTLVGFTAVGDTNAPNALVTWQIVLCNNTGTTTGAVAVSNAGQWWVALTANEIISGAPVPSALSNWSPFVLGGPNPPTNLQAK